MRNILMLSILVLFSCEKSTNTNYDISDTWTINAIVGEIDSESIFLEFDAMFSPAILEFDEDTLKFIACDIVLGSTSYNVNSEGIFSIDKLYVLETCDNPFISYGYQILSTATKVELMGDTLMIKSNLPSIIVADLELVR